MKQDRENTIIIFRHVVQSDTGDKLIADFCIQDPAYGNTAVMLSQTALLLLDDAKSLHNTNQININSNKPNGINHAGFLTAATALGYALIDRLNSLDTGIKISVNKFIPAK